MKSRLSFLLSSKVFWLGVGSICVGLYPLFQGEAIDVDKIAFGFALIFGRDTAAKIESKL